MELAKGNFLVRHATIIAIGAVTLFVFLAVLIFYWQGQASIAAKNMVMHTYEVRGHVRLLFSAIKDAEIGQRGYLMNKDTEYLQPYNEAIKDSAEDDSKVNSLDQRRSITEELDILQKLTADNPVQQRNIEELREIVKNLLKYFADTIKAQPIKTSSNIDQKIEAMRGKQMMDHIRILIRVIEAEESRLLGVRTEIDGIHAEQNQLVLFISVGIFYLTMVFSVLLYQKTRERTQAKLLQYMQELERNEEELKIQQEELKASNEEIEASNEEMEEKTRALEEQNARIQKQRAALEESNKLIEEKARELEVSNKYKSEFLANISHELRTPLNSLLILAKSLSGNEGGNLTDEQLEEAAVIYNGGLELLNLINDILDLSKVEAGKISLVPENVAIQDILDNLQRQFAPVVKESAVKFNIALETGLPATIYTDDQRVEQILKNLLSNAFKFTQKGSITIDVSRVASGTTLHREFTNESDIIAFAVTDTGIGIAEDKFKDIFEAFQQEDGSIDRHYGGTGLGLTISRKFAHILGGEIHVASKKGLGSKFTLYLPQVLPEKNLPHAENKPIKIIEKALIDEEIHTKKVTNILNNIEKKNKTLLIIEDDKNFARIISKIAQEQGYNAVVAGDGKTGLMFAVEQQVDAIILDMKLPDISGIDVLEQLKEDIRVRHIPVHIMTAYNDDNNAKALRKGAIGCLTKPVSKEDVNKVFKKIEELLGTDVKAILVVEDDKKTQSAINKLLQKKGLNITFVASGEKALQQIYSNKFDCIILDLKLPDMSGLALLEQLEQQDNAAMTPPVIIYTAKDLSEEENRKLQQYTGSIIIKGANSSERLLDEVTLFLHSVESTLSDDQKNVIRMQHDPDKILQGKKVLLTDDDLRNIFAVSKLLKQHGVEIVIADNGQMAIEKLAEEPNIELVIMDIMMPIMDGYQAIAEIRAQSKFNDLPIIALTARAMPEEQDKCIAVGASDYLTKPVDIERLLTLMRVLLFNKQKKVA